jgi:hypothetical protein
VSFARYYKPACRVVAGGIEVLNLDGEGLRIAFTVTRTLSPQPDVARVAIWGLSLERRRAIREIHKLTGALPLEVYAGWDGVAPRIFSGQGTRPQIDLSDDASRPALIVEAGDGVDGYSSAILEFTTYAITVLELVTLYAAPALVEPVAGETARTFPSSTVKVSATAIQTLNAAAGASVGTFDNGYAFSGTARELMNEVCRTIGAKWWIADGILEVVPARSPLPLPALLLAPPVLFDHVTSEDLGDLTGRAALEPTAVPGRLLIAQDANGVPYGDPSYRFEALTFTGDTQVGPWAMSFVARSTVGSVTL